MRLQVKEVFSYYLPQYHQIKENDEWWGEGFTEWSHFKKHTKLYPKHELHQPGELGCYILDNVEIIEKQYKLASSHSITSFAFWHYWFDDDDMLLQKPAEMLLNSTANVKFCFAWANHTWFNKSKNILLKEQKYDYNIEKHFLYLLPFFKDDRYTKVDGKPVFIIYNPEDAINCKEIISVFTKLAIKNGFDGVFFIGENSTAKIAEKYGLDLYLNSCHFMKHRSIGRKFIDLIKIKLNLKGFKFIRRYSYKECVGSLIKNLSGNIKEVPVLFPRWDSTIRHGKGGVVLDGSNPGTFAKHVNDCASHLEKKDFENRYIMVKSWNEWAEGNYMEPCSTYKCEYLNVFSKAFEVSKFECRTSSVKSPKRLDGDLHNSESNEGSLKF